jgi:hypothetical protein
MESTSLIGNRVVGQFEKNVSLALKPGFRRPHTAKRLMIQYLRNLIGSFRN